MYMSVSLTLHREENSGWIIIFAACSELILLLHHAIYTNNGRLLMFFSHVFGLQAFGRNNELSASAFMNIFPVRTKITFKYLMHSVSFWVYGLGWQHCFNMLTPPKRLIYSRTTKVYGIIDCLGANQNGALNGIKNCEKSVIPHYWKIELDQRE